MSRVTKEIAKEVAKGLTANHLAQIEKINEKIATIAVSEASIQTPQEVKDFYKKHPSYCNVRTSIYLRGENMNQAWVQVPALPWKGDGSTLILPAETGAKVQKLELKKRGIEKSMYELRKQIEQTVISLRTFKKVQEAFPEAAEFLPKGEAVYLPVVNLDVIRKELNVAFKNLSDE